MEEDDVNRIFIVIAVVLSAVALYLPARMQSFTRVVIDGHAIRMLVAGRGEPAVVFENGGGASLEMWGKVQPEVSRFATTVTYDRAGNGRDGRRIAAELHRALRAAGIAPPYLLVGASLGGVYVRIFADLYPEEVAGIVLVDPTFRATLDEARASRVPRGVPVSLIDAVSPFEVPFATESIRALRRSYRGEMQAESLRYRQWLDTIPGSRLIVTTRSGHNVPIEQPELVIRTIRDTVRGRS
jgi:pimeloyl-ACP methyl ester carboxylesterase